MNTTDGTKPTRERNTTKHMAGYRPTNRKTTMTRTMQTTQPLSEEEENKTNDKKSRP